MTNRDRLKKAFREASQRGLVARQNFACCGGCAGSELGEMARQRGKDGVVYYHRQDAERLRPGLGRYGRAGADHVYLGYGSVHDGDAATVDVGNKVCEALRGAGLAFEWDGTAISRIKVLLPGGIDGEPAPEPDAVPAGAHPVFYRVPIETLFEKPTPRLLSVVMDFPRLMSHAPRARLNASEECV